MPEVYSKRAGAEQPPEGAVYVGRPSPFGNPFVVGKHGDRKACLEKYERWIRHPLRQELRGRIRKELRGKDLACWCAPAPCHASVILEIANG